MKAIPWSEPNLYKFHSNPKKLDGYSDDLHYLPTASQIYDALDFYDEWYSWLHEKGNMENVPTEWSLDLLVKQTLDARYDYEEYDRHEYGNEEGVEPTLDKLSKVQLKWLYDFVMAGIVKHPVLNDAALVDAFVKFYKSKQ